MVQRILVVGIDCDCCLSVHAAHWPNERSRITSLRWIKLSHRRSVSHWSGRDFSRDASLNARTGQFTDRLCGCIQSEHVAARDLLVAAWFRARGLLFRLHLATLCRKSERSARHARVLMIYVHSLGRAARYFPAGTSLAANGTRSTFRDLHARVGRIAAALT